MSKPTNLHAGDGIAITDPSLGILLAYGNTAPTGEGYAPGCVFLKTNGTTVATAIYINCGTKAAANFLANIVSAGAVQTLTNKTIQATGAVTSSSASAGVGYATGAGGAVTQITSSSTGVTLNKVCGQITTVALTTAGAAEEVFTVTNSAVAATDVVVVSTTYAGAGTPIVSVKGVAAGSFVIVITNVDAAALNALMVINFAVIKGVAA